MYSRKNIKQLEDPLWKEAERQIDLIINYSNVQKIIFDYALLSKTKYFNMCDYNILLLPTNDELRKKAVIKRDNLENTEILDRRDKYSIDYRNYKFNKICINSYRENQFSVLKASILEELKNVNLGNINYTEIRE